MGIVAGPVPNTPGCGRPASKEAEAAEWRDCRDCWSPALADMQCCPRCGSTNLAHREPAT